MSSRKITSNVQSLPEQLWSWMNDEERIKRQDAERKARYANDSSGTDNPFKSADLAAPVESAPSAPVDPIFEAPMSRPSDSNMSPMEFSPKMSLKDELVDRSIDSTRLQSPEAKMMMSSADDPSQIINPGKLESPDARRMVIEDALKKKFEAPQMGNSQFSDDSMVADAIRQGGRDKLVAMLGSGGADLIKGATGFQADASPYNAMFSGAGNTEKTVRDYLSQKYDREAKKKAYELQLEELKSKNNYQKANLDLQKEQNDIARMKAASEVAKQAGQKVTPMGPALTEDDATKAKIAAESYDNYTTKLARLRELREKYGGEAYGAVKAEMDTLAAGALVDFKQAAQLGALSGSDMGLVEKALGDTSSHLISTESQLAKLDAAKRNADTQINAFAKARGLDASKVLKKTPMEQAQEMSLARQKRIQELKSKE